jgi:hypothetical protein
MKNTVIACAISLLAMGAAQAQGDPMHYVVGAGVTFGGDKLATTRYTNGSSSNIRAGSGLALLAGVDYRVSPEFSVQATVGYHIHFTQEASNGDADFRRLPVELLGYYHLAPQWRVGGGLRFVSNAKLHGSGAASGLNENFDNSSSIVAETEYFVNPKLGIKLRFANDEFKSERSKQAYSGKHVGLLANYYF